MLIALKPILFIRSCRSDGLQQHNQRGDFHDYICHPSPECLLSFHLTRMYG